MKKVILSIAMLAGMFLAMNTQNAQAAQHQPSICVVLEDKGFVDVQLEELSDTVQTAISQYTEEHTIKALKYNAELKITKVELTNKADESVKTVYLDAEGKEVEVPACPEKSEEAEQEVIEIPRSL